MTLADAEALDAADPLAFARNRFHLPSGVIYLDGNSLGALPAATPGRLAEVAERQWGGDLIASWTRHDWVDAPQRVAAGLAPIVGAAPDELLIADSTSVILFKLLAAAVRARPGRTVLLTEQGNFPTDLYVAGGLSRLVPGLRVKAVARAELAQALDGDVAALFLTHVDYKSGARHDMARLNAAVHEAGALTVWDLSHSAGAVALDIAGDGCDLALGCGYKYLNGGPGAPAFLFVATALQPDLDNVLSGWFGHAEPFDFVEDYFPAPDIGRFLTGTPSILALAALETGIATFDGVAMADLEAKSRRLSALFVAEVEARCPALALASPRDAADRGSHVVFAYPHGYAVMQALIERGVVGDFRAPDLLRFGFAPLYTRFADVWQAASVLAEIIDADAWDEPRFHQRARVT